VLCDQNLEHITRGKMFVESCKQRCQW